MRVFKTVIVITLLFVLCVAVVASGAFRSADKTKAPIPNHDITVVRPAIAHSTSLPLYALAADSEDDERGEFSEQNNAATIPPPVITTPSGAEKTEQRSLGTKPGATLVVSFDGLGAGFTGPQGTATLRNPSDNSLAVGPNHIMQTVNTRTAIFDKKGNVLYGPVPNNTVFKGFGGACEAMNNGDTVVRYDQLADRWLIVMPTFRRGEPRPDQPEPGRAGEPAQLSVPGQAHQPGAATKLFVPPVEQNQPPQPRGQGNGQRPPESKGVYSMCYAVSATSDPLGAYYRYEFLRPLFPDYPRPAIWPDGYYIPTSTGDNVIQKHACVAERDKMLKGEPAREQCVIVDDVNFLNNADIDGKALPPPGAPNVMMAAGGTQLKKVFEDDGIYVWKFKVDWKNPANTNVTGPEKIAVAP